MLPILFALLIAAAAIAVQFAVDVQRAGRVAENATDLHIWKG